MSETQQRRAPAGDHPESDALINAALIGGLTILVICQLMFSSVTMRQRRMSATGTLDGAANAADPGIRLAGSAMQLVSCSDDDLSNAVAFARPAVVNIDVASSDVGPAAKRGGPALDFDVPPPGALSANEETLGSGIIVDPRGYVLTCYHLIRNHPRVYVTVFSSDPRVHPAVVVDLDITNDLALLKIPADSPVPVAKLANSDLVKVTDSILAIGSPFGFEHTVTAGIVSDNARSIVIAGAVYHDLLQTDASVNRGSAGGALINTEGEVIGINMAIASASGCFSGISFAIPINRARALLLRAIEG